MLTSYHYPVTILLRMIPRIDPDVRYIGSSKLRELTAIELRALTGAIVVQGANNTPLVVILPYETYLRIQDAAHGPRQKGDKGR